MSEPNTELTVFFCRHRFPPNSNTCEYCGETLPHEAIPPPAEMKLPHSPLPWKIDSGGEILDASGHLVEIPHDAPFTPPDEKANAELIVASVNRHAELVEALRKCIEALEVCEAAAAWGDGFPMIAHEAMDKAKALTEPGTDL